MVSKWINLSLLSNLQIQKYSQFINFPIYLWSEKTITEEVPLSEEELAEQADEEAEVEKDDDDEEDDEEAEV